MSYAFLLDSCDFPVINIKVLDRKTPATFLPFPLLPAPPEFVWMKVLEGGNHHVRSVSGGPAYLAGQV
jgi:hypothetical protein